MLNIFPNVRRLYHEDERAQFDFVQPNVDFKKEYGVSIHDILKNEVWIDSSKCQPKTYPSGAIANYVKGSPPDCRLEFPDDD